MNKLFSFLAGALAGSLVGAVLVLLLTPASGEELRAEAVDRWQYVLDEARKAMEETSKEMEAQFEKMKSG